MKANIIKSFFIIINYTMFMQLFLNYIEEREKKQGGETLGFRRLLVVASPGIIMENGRWCAIIQISEIRFLL